jgi:uncharacterized lipoprotein
VTARRIIVASALTVAALLGLSACDWSDKVTEPFRDADRTGRTNSAPVDIIENADGFSNVSTKCDHGNRLYIAYHGDALYAAVAVVPQDPTCR